MSIILLYSFLGLSVGLFAQYEDLDVTITRTAVLDEDTMPFIALHEVEVHAFNFETERDKLLFNRMVRRVEKAYPYVKMGKELLEDLEAKENDSKKRQYKKYKKERERDLRLEFEEELKNMSVSQGKVLIKMVNRETEGNFYQLVKQLKGGMQAAVFQLIAKRYGYDLKEEYKAEDNELMEMAIMHVESYMGKL